MKWTTGQWLALACAFALALVGVAGNGFAQATELHLSFKAGDIIDATSRTDVVAQYETNTSEIPGVTAAPSSMRFVLTLHRRFEVIGQKDGDTILREHVRDLYEERDSGKKVTYIRDGEVRGANSVFEPLTTPCDYRITQRGLLTPLSKVSPRKGLGLWTAGAGFLFPELPGKPVQVGDSWSQTTVNAIPGARAPLQSKTTYRLEEIHGGLAGIAFERTMSTVGTLKAGTEITDSTTALQEIDWQLDEAQWKSTGKHLFDVESGHVAETSEQGNYTSTVRTRSNLGKWPLTVELRQQATFTRRTIFTYDVLR